VFPRALPPLLPGLSVAGVTLLVQFGHARERTVPRTYWPSRPSISSRKTAWLFWRAFLDHVQRHPTQRHLAAPFAFPLAG
jgi:hypothetical protein